MALVALGLTLWTGVLVALLLVCGADDLGRNLASSFVVAGPIGDDIALKITAVPTAARPAQSRKPASTRESDTLIASVTA